MAMLNQRVLVLVTTPCKKNSREQKTTRMIFLEIRGEKLFRSLVEQGDSGEDWNTTSCITGITLWEMKKHEKKHRNTQGPPKNPIKSIIILPQGETSQGLP